MQYRYPITLIFILFCQKFLRPTFCSTRSTDVLELSRLWSSLVYQEMHYPHKWTENDFLHSVVSQISIFPNEGFCSESSSFPPTFLQKLWPVNDLFCSKSSIILSEVGMDILGTIYKSCALKYQVEGNRINKKINSVSIKMVIKCSVIFSIHVT